jgi:hypothetical protein
VFVAPTVEVMRNVKEILRDAMLKGTPGQRKALLKELVVEVRVESRDSIIPTFATDRPFLNSKSTTN